MYSGMGTYVWQDGSKHIGYYLNDLSNSFGTLFDSKGNVQFEGYWRNGKPHGRGTEIRDNCTYTGSFVDGKRDG